MTARASEPEPRRPEPREIFRLAAGRPVVTILASLFFLALAGLGAAAVFSTKVDIEPLTPTPGPVRVETGSLPAVPVLAFLAQTLSPPPTSPPPTSAPPPSSPGGEAPPIGESTGEIVRFGPEDEGVMVVPEDWSVLAHTGERLTLGNGSGARLAARVYRVDAGQPATQLVSEAFTESIRGAGSAHVRESPITGFQPFGSIVSYSGVGYSALRADAQGVSAVGGNLFVFVRDDGLALSLHAEIDRPGLWEERIEEWFPLFERAASNFAGATLPIERPAA